MHFGKQYEKGVIFMNKLNGFSITARDRALRAWQVSTGLVREYQEYAKEVEGEDKKLSELFATLSLNEAEHSSEIKCFLEKYD